MKHHFGMPIRDRSHALLSGASLKVCAHLVAEPSGHLKDHSP